ncbi:MAG TPA: hypothetical protein VFF23_14700 [Hanamia sp.]|nr:hypothetical protein [Hanamia sp.]
MGKKLYALKYTCTFDPIDDLSAVPVYIIEIFQKGYSGEVFTLIGGTVPVLHNWETDDPKAPVKGSSLALNFISKDNGISIFDFSSTEDDTFKVRFKYLDNILFEGFLVQDDFSEPLLDYTHEISLSANDALGLLKDVSLDKANIFSFAYQSGFINFGADFNTRTFLFTELDESAQPGDHLIILGHTIVDGTYTITKIVRTDGLSTTLIYVDEPIPDNYIGEMYYQIWKPANLLNKTPLSTILRMCLSVTGLELNTNVYSKINEISQDTSRCFLEQTLIDPQTFLKSDTEYTDCYDVLTKILGRFNMTLFQANGAWNIVRWDELRYFNNLIEGFSYDKDFNSLGAVTLPAIHTAGIGENSEGETGLLRKFIRPFLYDKETFNYSYPRQLLRNFDLKQLGSLIRTYTKTVWITPDGVAHESDPGGAIQSFQTYTEYAVPWWYSSALLMSVAGDYFIRVIADNDGNEIERVLVVNGDIKSYPIEVNRGDSFKFSFRVKTQDSQSGSINLVAVVELNDGVTRKFFHNPALTNGGNMWQDGVGFVYQIPASDNSNQWHEVEIDSHYFPFPYDGLLYCYLRVYDFSNPKNETYYSDIRFEYTVRLNESTKIIGQTHQQTQAGVIKNNEDVEIFIDSSPRNSIAGTLFLDEKIGLLQKRTAQWRHPYKPTQSVKLGDLITYEQLFWRRITRTVLEGTLYGLISSGTHISLLSVFKYSYFPELNFVFGKMEIDYKNNKVNGTLWEMWNDEETDVNLPGHYTFNYLYSTT